MVHRRVIPRGARLSQDPDRTLLCTLAGVYTPLGKVIIKQMCLPGFDKSRIITEHKFNIFKQECRYDVILGRDFLSKIGVNLKYDTSKVEWFGNTIPIVSLHQPSQVTAQVESYLPQMNNTR